MRCATVYRLPWSLTPWARGRVGRGGGSAVGGGSAGGGGGGIRRDRKLGILIRPGKDLSKSAFSGLK